MEKEQKQDMVDVFGKDWKNLGDLDYVCAWYKKVIEYIKGTNIKCAFVSTNSLCQGSSVGNLWKKLFEEGIEIIFAYRTFKWGSESNDPAAVMCIVVGFRNIGDKKINKYIYDKGLKLIAKNINGYLMNAENIAIEARNMPLCNIPEIGIGNQPIDDGNYLFTEDEKNDFIRKEPKSEKYFKRWYGSDEFINNKIRYCLWLGDVEPNELKSLPLCMQRVKNVQKFREGSKRSSTLKLSKTPTRFQTENMPKSNYILIPETSSENRNYIPIGFMNKDVLCSNAVRLMPNASLYHFAILTSNVHMRWMRVVAGRLKSDYRYSKDIVYNNFPWPIDISKGDKDLTNNEKGLIKNGYPTIDKECIEALEKTGKAILDARNLKKDLTLADMYDVNFAGNVPELMKAHEDNNKVVCKDIYKLNKEQIVNEFECVKYLFELYKVLTV